METSVAGVLIFGVLIVAVVLLAQAIVVSNAVMGSAIKESASAAGERARTELSFDTSTSDGTTLTVDVDNAGNTSISDYNEMDLIVEYPETGTLTMQYQRLAYVAASPGAGEWTDTSRTPDQFQPGTWDSGETLRITAIVSPVQASGTTGTVAVASPNGVAATGTFTRP